MSAEPTNALRDDSGYVVTKDVLDFLGVTTEAVAAFQARQHPLGVSRDEFEGFKTSLDTALKRDDVTVADVRLQGSSSNFFSGKHKTMPFQRDEVLDAFVSSRGRGPDPEEFERICKRLEGVWPSSAPRPERRPFDSLNRLGIERFPSDVDVQISSDQIVERAEAWVEDLGIPPERVVVANRNYNFVKKEYVAEVCPFLTSWALRQSDILPRPVTIAVFPGSGPPQTQKPLSSHFRASDWRVYLGGGGE